MPDSLLDDIIKALKGEKKSELINQILKEKALYDALKEAGLTIVAEDTHERAREMPYGVLSKVQKIDELTLLKTLEVLEEITVIKKIETILSVPDSTPKGSEGTAFKQNTAGAGAWVYPTGYDDPDDKWTAETHAYDGNTATGAFVDFVKDTWTSFIYFTHDSIKSNMVKIYVSVPEQQLAYDIIDIDVLKDGVWTHVYEGQATGWWYQYSFGEGNVTQVRIRYKPSVDWQGSDFLREIQLWQVPSTGGELIVKQLEKDRTISEGADIGTWLDFSGNATQDVVTPPVGKKVKVHSAFYYCQADVISELRFKNTGAIILGLPTKGAIGMNPILQAKPTGEVNEVVEFYVSGTGYCKGWIVAEAV